MLHYLHGVCYVLGHSDKSLTVCLESTSSDGAAHSFNAHDDSISFPIQQRRYTASWKHAALVTVLLMSDYKPRPKCTLRNRKRCPRSLR